MGYFNNQSYRSEVHALGLSRYPTIGSEQELKKARRLIDSHGPSYADILGYTHLLLSDGSDLYEARREAVIGKLAALQDTATLWTHVLLRDHILFKGERRHAFDLIGGLILDTAFPADEADGYAESMDLVGGLAEWRRLKVVIEAELQAAAAAA